MCMFCWSLFVLFLLAIELSKEEQTTQWPKERKSTKGQTTIYKTYINIRRVWRYQRSNQNLYIKEEQTTQWSFGHWVVCSSLIYRFWLLLWYLQTLLMFMYVLLIVVCPICISKKNRQLNGQKKKYKRTNNDLQNIHKHKKSLKIPKE
jgi:Flp pilus assembly protein TadB